MAKNIIKNITVGLLVGLLAGGLMAAFFAICGLDIAAIALGGGVMFLAGFGIGLGGYALMRYEEAVWDEGDRVLLELRAMAKRLRQRSKKRRRG